MAGNKVDVLVINPSALSSIYQSLSNELAAIEPPIWAGLIANHLRMKGHSLHLIDAEGEGLTVADTVKRSAECEPKLTVIVVYGQQPSASTQNMYAAHILCDTYKEAYPERKVLMIGGHVSALPETTLLQEKCDFVCKGEGPATITGLLSINMDDSSQYKQIPGLWWREGGKPVSGTPGANIPQEKLTTELPGIAWDLLPMKNYRAHNWHSFGHINERKPYASIYTSLGCPFKCTFCCINAPFGGSSFRYWDPEFIANEFETLTQKYGVKNVKIADEMFVLRESHFLKLAQLLGERGYAKDGLNIWAYARVDTVKPQYLEPLKKAGVNWLALGIESGSKHVRDGVTKGRFGESDIRSIVKQIKDAGINVIGNYIFGLPDDNYESMQQTLDLSLELNCEMGNFYSAMAYPGSKLYTMAVERNWPLPDSWLGYSQHAFETLPLPTEHISAGEVLAFRDKAFQVYFNDPTYLNMVRSKFGEDTYKHIVDMTKHQLKRKNAAPLKVEPTGREGQSYKQYTASMGATEGARV
ncbi:MAG TPA: radical SAM protein [Pseudobdellovibrionaceae bacterium]|nr:radical SAM protein [Pseudobdellovibrionaceae bacterium]